MAFAILLPMPPRSIPKKDHRLYSLRRSACFQRLAWSMVFLVSASPSTCRAQGTQNPSHPTTDLQQQYDSAVRAQTAGDKERATLGYRDFLAAALRRLAQGRMQLGDYPGATRLFEEALAVAPSDAVNGIRIDYAEAALLSRDIPKARALSQALLVDEPKNSRARLVLGEALLQTDENDEARKQLEAAVALDPSYKNGLALATAYLALSDTKDATRVFTEMAASFGDKATVHLDFGRAYAEAGYPQLAIAEFEKAIAKEPTLLEAHYCLGASYLLDKGAEAFPKATREFNRELQLHPNDYFSLSQLGYIALTERRFPDAEAALKRASLLDSHNPDNPLLLGQVYTELNQPAQAEQAFRQAIALTTDPSRNHYQVQRAHYLLGRLLLQTGRSDEGKQEMQISAALLKQNLARDQVRLAGTPMGATATPPQLHAPDPALVDARTKRDVEDFSARVAPALADSYNNLGAIAAGSNEFATATRYFEQAAKWNPTLEGLDYNWGRAAFSAEFYAQAAPPLSRYLAAHPQEEGARRVLGISLFMIKDYAATVRTLRPIEQELTATPQLDYMYAQSLVLTGDYDQGVARLQRMSKTNPSVAEVHRALGEAYASHGDYQQASGELRTAINLNAADSEATDQLALVLAHLEKKTPTSQP
jgi:tetratricopeptide (TPR) repeat protein